MAPTMDWFVTETTTSERGEIDDVVIDKEGHDDGGIRQWTTIEERNMRFL